MMLNSNNPKNIRIGLVEGETLTGVKEFGKVSLYSDLDTCKTDLFNYRISVCIKVQSERPESSKYIEVYIDNARQIIDFYVRKTVLERLFSEQAQFIDHTRNEIDSKMLTYSFFVNESLSELDKTENELKEQEALLSAYQKDLREFKEQFDQVYTTLQSIRSQISSTKQNIQEASLKINQMTSGLQTLRGTLQELQNSLQQTLEPAEYEQVTLRIESLFVSLTELETTSSLIENNIREEKFNEIFDRIDQLYEELTPFKIKLDQIDSDISLSLERTNGSITRIQGFKSRLQEIETDLGGVGSADQGSLSLSFIGVRSFSDDLVRMSFPFVVSIIVIFSSLVLSNKFILNNAHQSSYLRELMTPTKGIHFVIADYLVNLFFVFIQIAVLIFFGWAWFEFSFAAIPGALLSLFLVSSIMIFVGISIGYFIKSESISILITVFALMFSFVCSDLLVPSVLSGSVVRFLINLNPLVIINNFLFNTLLLEQNLEENLFLIGRLVVMFISSFLIAVISKKVSKENAFS